MGLEAEIWASRLGGGGCGGEEEGGIVAKALDGQRYPLPLCEYMWMCDGERGSGPEGVDDLCFHTYGGFSPSSSSPPHPPSPQPRGPYLSLKAHIPASRPKS